MLLACCRGDGRNRPHLYRQEDHICTTILDRVRQDSSPPRFVVLDLSAAPYMDLQSSHALADLGDELRKRGIRVQVVEARAGVRDRLHGEGLDARLGDINRYMSVADALDKLQAKGTTERASDLPSS